jgi:hypothetical protein
MSKLAELTHDDMRRCMRLADNTMGADRWTALQWLRLWLAYIASDWDVTPCQWTARQVQEALNVRRPLAPNWDGDLSKPCNGIPMTGKVRA